MVSDYFNSANAEKNSLQVAAVGLFNLIGVVYSIIRRDFAKT
jgi:hypothetical protein